MDIQQAASILIDFYSEIPRNKWTTDILEDSDKCRCAVGHLVAEEGHRSRDSRRRTLDAMKVIRMRYLIAANDNVPDLFKESGIPVPFGATPKDRVLDMLYKIKSKP